MSTAKKQQEIAQPDNKALASTQDPGTIMQVISRAASDPDTDVEKMERLLGMYERFQARQAEAEYYDALSEMQDELPVITERGKIEVRGETRSTYAKFEDINEVVKPILKAHGFAVSFRTGNEEGAVRVTGILSHKAGHKEETSLTLPIDDSGQKNKVQAIGSSTSYAKRYVLSALLNLTSRGEDDDGRLADKPTITDEQAGQIHDYLAKTESDEAKFLKWAGADCVENIRADLFPTVISKLKRKAEKS